MDALACYGNSSSEEEGQECLTSPSASPTVALVADSCCKEENIDNVALTVNKENVDNNEDFDNCGASAEKEGCQRLSGNSFYKLPKPLLLTDKTSSFDSLVYAGKSYLDSLEKIKIQEVPPDLKENLQTLLCRFGKAEKSTFAEHIRSQKEFHNPHFFSETISHFNIDSGGSNFPSNLFGGYRTFEEGDRIMKEEEQARICAAHREQASVDQHNGVFPRLPLPN